jgi:hypothetical protein
MQEGEGIGASGDSHDNLVVLVDKIMTADKGGNSGDKGQERGAA